MTRRETDIFLCRERHQSSVLQTVSTRANDR